MARAATAIDSWKLLSKSQIAQAWGVSRDTVTRLIQDVAADGQKAGHDAWSIRTAATKLAPYDLGICAEDATGKKDPEQMPAKERKDWYDGEDKRLIVAAKKRELISTDEMSESLIMVFDALKTFVVTLPDVLERDADLEPEKVQYLITRCDQLLSDFTEQLSSNLPNEVQKNP